MSVRIGVLVTSLTDLSPWGWTGNRGFSFALLTPALGARKGVPVPFLRGNGVAAL